MCTMPITCWFGSVIALRQCSPVASPSRVSESKRSKHAELGSSAPLRGIARSTVECADHGLAIILMQRTE
jgi:hypothetical protein